MSEEALGGAAETDAFFSRLPAAAREELAVELAILAREGLRAQQAATPVDKGDLKAGLSLQLLTEYLKVRFGLLGLKRGRAKLFYGIIVNEGRKAQTVLVERRKRVNGRLRTRRNRKIAEDIIARYPLRVRARGAVDFIDAPGPDFESDAFGQLNEYWERTLSRAGGGA